MITRQDIIDIANEVYLDDCVWVDDSDSKPINDLVKFGELLSNKVIRICRIQEAIAVKLAVDAAIMREREACAKVCEERSDPLGYANLTAEVCAKAIRARDQE